MLIPQSRPNGNTNMSSSSRFFDGNMSCLSFALYKSMINKKKLNNNETTERKVVKDGRVHFSYRKLIYNFEIL